MAGTSPANQLNPFPVKAYQGPAYFCNRQPEVALLKDAADNGRHITLFSRRKIGKTGLLQHYFHSLKRLKKYRLFYVDLYQTESQTDFVKALGAEIIRQLDAEPKNIFTKAMAIFRQIRPIVDYDGLTGQPRITITMVHPDNPEPSMEELMGYLRSEGEKNTVIVALDEFQQISNYPEKNTEATLRSFIQFMPGVQFIFSGSHQHLLLQMFSDATRPFYQSTQMLHLEKLDIEKYGQFILSQFANGKRQITGEAVKEILSMCRTHTYYVQFICNRLYSRGIKKITVEDARRVMNDVLKEQEMVFYNYRTLLGDQQWQLLRAIAKEEVVTQPTANKFLRKHTLSGASTVQKSLQGLINKHFVDDQFKKAYEVSDVFLSRWLQWRYDNP